MEIRKVKQGDFNQYLQLRKEDIKEYSKIIKENIHTDSSQIKKEFDGMLKSKDHLILVAEEENKIIGYLTGSIIKNIWQHSGYIDDVFTSKDSKRKGVGFHLIQTFIKYLKTKGIKNCKLEVNKKNNHALKLYKKLGFETTSYEMDLKI